MELESINCAYCTLCFPQHPLCIIPACRRLSSVLQFLMDMKECHCRPSRCLAVWESCFIASLGGLLRSIKVNDDAVNHPMMECVSQALAMKGMERQTIHALLGMINMDCKTGGHTLWTQKYTIRTFPRNMQYFEWLV